MLSMSDRKSNRARKAVDYTKFGGGDDDDDFADSTPPVSKRAKLSNKENKEKMKSLQKKDNKQKASRQSVEERLYERELQEALQLSMSQSDGSQESTSTPVDTSTADQPPILIKDDDDDRTPSPILPHLDVAPVLVKMCDQSDDIEVLESNIEVVQSSRNQKKKAKKYIDSDSESVDFEVDLRRFLNSPLTPKCQKKSVDSDSDFNPADADDSFDDGADDSDDDNDYNGEDSDSDFGPSKKKKSVKTPAAESKQAVKKPTTSSRTVNSAAAGTKKSSKAPAPKLKQCTGKKTSSVNKSSPVTATCRTPTTSLVARKPPNWKPPGSASEGKSPIISNNKARPAPSGSVNMSPLGGVNIKSPNSGLRIGLSRNMKLKPLHPNLKTQT